MVEWATATITPPPALLAASPAYPTTLYLNNTPVAIVSVLIPIENGLLVPPNNEILAPDATTTILDQIVIAHHRNPFKILFRRDNVSTTTNTSTPYSVASSTTSPQISLTSLMNNVALTSMVSHAATSQPVHCKMENMTAMATVVTIVSLIMGATTGALIGWGIWGKRRSSPRHKSDHERLTPDIDGEKQVSSLLSVDMGSVTISSPNGGLTQSPESKALSKQFSELGSSIKTHVQSYYHSKRVCPALIDHDDVQTLGPHLPISTGTLSTLLENSTTREIALRFCIAWVVLSGVQGRSDHSNSFLPASIVQCFQELTSSEHESKRKFSLIYKYSATNNFASDALLVKKWRILTANLLQSTYIQCPFTSSDGRNSAVQAAVHALDNILQPYADSRMDNKQRKHNLEELLQRSALFAFALFGQSSCWEFDWKEEQGVKSGELCVFPALIQVTDDSGEPLRTPQPFSEAVIRRLSS